MGKLFEDLPAHYQVFVTSYMADGNASRAAKKAGSRAKDLYVAGNALLRKPNIQAALREIKSEAAEKLKITPGRVLNEFARIGFADIRNMFDDFGRLKPIREINDDLAAAISSIKVVTRKTGDSPQDVEYVHEIKLWNKNQSLDSLSKHLGLFEKDNSQKGEHIVILHDPTNPEAKEDSGGNGDS